MKAGELQYLTHVEVPDADDAESYNRLVLKEDMEQALLAHHKTHFSQAHGTPFTEKAIVQRVGDATETPLTRRFREGLAEAGELGIEGEYGRQFLQRLQPTNRDPSTISCVITNKEVRRGFSIWKEKTSTSPSGRILTL